MRILRTTICVLAMPLLVSCASEPAEPDEYGARDVCETFVEKRLKAPASAEYENTTTSESAGEWTVEGDVDAANSFGAQIRTHYVCTVTPIDAEGTNWELVDIQVDE